MNTLLEMLSYRRPGGSRTERAFIREYIAPLGAKPDGAGNYVLRVGDSRVAWMCHTDTVHYQGGRQRVMVTKGIARAPGSNCLGADDTTGVWLMTEMIRAKVPGLYIFHRGEESGCVGSSRLVTETPEVVDGIDFAISLDRKGTDSVITHQLGRHTASDAFAWSLAGALGLDMEPDPSGVYTDSEVYAHIVPECTNLSVGYDAQHTMRESQDLDFACTLGEALCRFDESKLVVDRNPDLCEDDPWYLDPAVDWGDEDDTLPCLAPGCSGRVPWISDDVGYGYGDYCDACLRASDPYYIGRKDK